MNKELDNHIELSKEQQLLKFLFIEIVTCINKTVNQIQKKKAKSPAIQALITMRNSLNNTIDNAPTSLTDDQCNKLIIRIAQISDPAACELIQGLVESLMNEREYYNESLRTIRKTQSQIGKLSIKSQKPSESGHEAGELIENKQATGNQIEQNSQDITEKMHQTEFHSKENTTQDDQQMTEITRLRAENETLKQLYNDKDQELQSLRTEYSNLSSLKDNKSHTIGYISDQDKESLKLRGFIGNKHTLFINGLMKLKNIPAYNKLVCETVKNLLLDIKQPITADMIENLKKIKHTSLERNCSEFIDSCEDFIDNNEAHIQIINKILEVKEKNINADNQKDKPVLSKGTTPLSYVYSGISKLKISNEIPELAQALQQKANMYKKQPDIIIQKQITVRQKR
jgi:hypothetical protein